MRKGSSLETKINKLIDHVDGNGYFAQRNHPRRSLDGRFLEGEKFDYIIVTPTQRLAFDAKECHADKWRFTDKEIRQANNLKKCKNSGFEAFFLIYFFTAQKLLAFDVDVFAAALKEGRKYLTQDEGSEWSWTNF